MTKTAFAIVLISCCVPRGLTPNHSLTARFPAVSEKRLSGLSCARLNMMPMNGFSVLDRLAQLRLKLPVIVITGEDKEVIYERAMNKGISAFLRKPVDGQVLLDAIEDAVGNRT